MDTKGKGFSCHIENQTLEHVVTNEHNIYVYITYTIARSNRSTKQDTHSINNSLVSNSQMIEPISKCARSPTLHRCTNENKPTA